jgi:uncharacterized protein with ParB-like and HNH nuclease domain
MKLEAVVASIKKILVDDEKFYQIPDYQRPYSWDKDNLSDLVDDLINAYLSNKEENYFCGSLVLVDNKNDSRFDIIDGQQRTTTFTILACVFRDIYFTDLSPKSKKYIQNSIQDEFEENKRKLKFLTNENYQIDFEETVLKKIDFIDTKHIEKDFPNNKYLQNAHFLRSFLVEKISDELINIDNFVIWFYENVVLTVITCPSQDSAIQIFNVLNDRGMPLSSIDILKSSLMQKIKDSKEDRRAFKTKWEEINSNLKFLNFDIESMLTTYLYYKIATNPKSRLDKELINVFEKEDKNSLEIINEINEFSKSYINLLTKEDKYVYCLKYLRHNYYWTSILCTALFHKYEYIDELKKLLLAYYYQNWIAGATVARIKQTSFNILKAVKSNKSIEDIKKEIKQNINKYSTTKTYLEELSGSWVYRKKWDKPILLLLEYFFTEDTNQKFIPIDNKLHLEHILPQKPFEYGWDKIFTEDEIYTWTNSLANLTLLSMRKNVQAINYDFKKKKDIYQNADNVITAYTLTQDIINNYQQWTTQELKKRGDELVEKVNMKLNII